MLSASSSQVRVDQAVEDELVEIDDVLDVDVSRAELVEDSLC